MGVRLVIVAITVLSTLAVAVADDKPWAVGVSPRQQRDALALYRDGNAFIEQSQYKEALAKYELALAFWDHPAIRYNAAICLINMDRLVDAYDHLTRALRFGAAPLGGDVYQEGLRYEELLAGRLAELEIVCREPGAEVTLDGKPLFVGPGARLQRTLRGSHQVVATKHPSHLPETRSFDVTPGTKLVVTLELKRREARVLRRRWTAWKPWAVVAGGTAIGLAGVPLWFRARSDFDSFDGAVRDVCPDGCPGAELTMRAKLADPDGARALEARVGLRGRAEVERVATYGAFAVGGAVLATGFALVILNQPRLSSTVVAPFAGSDQAGVVMAAPW